MSNDPSTFLVVGVVATLVFVIMFVLHYNKIVRLRNHCDEAWSNIDTELKRRYSLVPNLVRTVKGYAMHEREVLTELVRLRDRCANDGGSPQEQAESENLLVGALNRLMVQVERYPDLKANHHFLALQRELANTEDRIQAARRFYNGNVREHNNAVQMFPGNVLAFVCSFEAREFFEIESADFRKVPAVDG